MREDGKKERDIRQGARERGKRGGGDQDGQLLQMSNVYVLIIITTPVVEWQKLAETVSVP